MARYLLCADIHLGVRSADVPEDLPGYRTEDAWLRLCEIAAARAVDAVVVAGDLIDGRSALLPAIGAIRRGLAVLNGIPVYTTAGNHDYGSLPAAAKALDRSDFVVIGGADREGWGECELPGGTPLYGWSFTREKCVTSAWASSHCPTRFQEGLGVTHGTVDGSATDIYHAIPAHRLTDAGFWLVGHYHARRDGGHWGYPGSLQAMDFGERGERGAWLLDTADWSRETIEVSTARYRALDISVEAEDDVDMVVSRAGTALADEARDDGYLVVHVRFTGRSGLRREDWEKAEETLKKGFTQVKVRGVSRAIRPSWNANELVARDGLTGRLARVIVSLEAAQADQTDPYRDDPTVQRLVRSTMDAADRVLKDPGLAADLRRGYSDEHDVDQRALAPITTYDAALEAARRLMGDVLA